MEAGACGTSPPGEESRAAVLEQRLTALTSEIPGLVARVDDAAHGFHWVGAAGVADVATGAPSRPDHRFRAGSIAKLLQAIAFLRLQDSGRLSLSDPLAVHLPGLLADGDAITVHQLLRHESGLVDYVPLQLVDAPALLAQRFRVWHPVELIQPALDAPRLAAPGSTSVYSNTNFVLSALVLEAVTGRPYEEVVDELVLAPLGLVDSYLVRRDQVGIEGGHQTGYLAEGPGQITEFTSSSMSWGWGAGALVSTVDDLAALVQGLFGGQLLSPASLAQMTELVPQLDHDDPLLASDHGFPVLYGLGLMGWSSPCGSYLGHQGGTADSVSVLAHSPTRERTVVINANVAAGLSTQAQVLGWVRDAMCD